MRWYLIHTKPAGEKAAEINLTRQGYEIYFPRLLQSLERGLKCCERVVPLFPRYLFLRLREGTQALAPARSSVGVSNVVRFGADYAVVPDRIVREITSRADPDTGLHRLKATPPPMAGEAVRIVRGPFEGLEGVFQRPAGEERVVVLLSLLGQEAQVRVPATFVAAGHAV
jgi:transcriptional antiterminator RfaH